MRHAKLITIGILILTFFFVKEIQHTVFLKIKSAGSQISQTELVAFLWQDRDEDEMEEDSRGLMDPYPQASALNILVIMADKLISVTKQAFPGSK